MLDLTPQEIQLLLNVLELVNVKGEANMRCVLGIIEKLRKALEEQNGRDASIRD